MSERHDVPEFRRNLSLAACQPCRKAKIGCDHEQPCSRCVKRGLQHVCVYRTVEDRSIIPVGSSDIGPSPSPGFEQRLKQIERSLQNLQRQLQPEASSTTSRKRRRDEEEEVLHNRFLQSSSTRPKSRPATDASQTKGSSFEAPPDDDHLQASDNDEGVFVGPNTDNDLLGEFISTREQFRGFLDALPTHPPIGSALPLWVAPSEEWKFRQSRQELGERILKCFPPKAICDDLLRVYFGVFNHIRPCVPRHWADQALQEIFEIDGGMEFVETTPDTVGIIESHKFDGPSLCSAQQTLVNWNTIGTLAAMFAIAAYTAPQLLDTSDLCLYTRVNDVHDFALKMRKVVGMCWELQKPTEYADESTILLLYHYAFMLIVFGEYIPFLEHLFGCLVQAAAVNHLHREAPRNEHNSDYLNRRRTEYAAIYHLDKMRATYRGRPPSMFHRFSDMQLPSTTTQEDRHLRGQLILSQAREEVLELIMTSPRGPSIEKLRHAQTMVLDRYNLITPELKYDHTTPLTTSKPSLNAQRIILYLFSLENSFILQSAAKRRPKAFPESDLLKVSLSMFSTVVRVWEEREEFENFTFLLSWLLYSYAMAAAGVIFSTILQQGTGSSSSKISLPPPFHSKPYHLHQLQQFLSALRSIEPNDPHFDRCKKALRIFSRVHEVLVGQPTASATPAPYAPAPTDLQPPLDAAPTTGSDSASTDYYSEWGLNQNLGGFGTLPWLHNMWVDPGGDDLPEMLEGMDTAPLTGSTGMEDWDGLLGGG